VTLADQHRIGQAVGDLRRDNRRKPATTGNDRVQRTARVRCQGAGSTTVGHMAWRPFPILCAAPAIYARVRSRGSPKPPRQNIRVDVAGADHHGQERLQDRIIVAMIIVQVIIVLCVEVLCFQKGQDGDCPVREAVSGGVVGISAVYPRIGL